MRARLCTGNPRRARRRVLFLNWRDTDHPEGGGSEHLVEQLAQGLQARGYDVTLRCARYPGSVHEARLGEVERVRQGGRFSVYLRAMLHLAMHPRRYELVVDVSNGVPFWSPLVTRTPVIALVHHVHRDVWPVVFGARTARIGWWLESQLAPRVYSRSRYATVSETTLRELVDLGVDPAQVTLVYNGSDVPVETGEPVSRTEWPSLVVLGRLVPHKRVELAIEALAGLRAEFPDATLTVIGRGYWEPRLRLLTEQLHVGDGVNFAGYVDDATKHRLLAQSWLHVLPSIKEGWGLAVLDAGMSGTASVAFRSAGGTTESILDGSTGVLVGDGEDLGDRLAELLRQPELCRHLGSRAQVYAQAFTWERTVDRFARLVDLVLHGERWERLPQVSVPPPRSPDADVGIAPTATVKTGSQGAL